MSTPDVLDRAGRTPEEVTRRGPLFWVSAAIGAAGIGVGLHGLFSDPIDTRPTNWAKFFFGGVIVHDAVFAPFVLAAGYLLARAVPGRLRAYVQGGLLIVGCLALFAWPYIRDYAAPQHNPTSLPYDYTANLLAVSFAVVVAVVITAVGQRMLGRRASPAGPVSPGPVTLGETEGDARTGPDPDR